MDKEQFLDYFATASFRDTADNEYIVARMAYRADLGAQFLWSSLHSGSTLISRTHPKRGIICP